MPFLRVGVQVVFLLTCIIIGIQFYLFVGQLESGNIPSVTRPPGVEGFLPISALISFKYFYMTGVVNMVHPSGMFIFVFICMTGVFLKRSFCSWICPIGLVNELLTRVHFKAFKKGVRIPKWVDLALRSIKYFILAFFLWTIVFKMNVFVLKRFIYSPFNILADLKMLKFFTEISPTALAVFSAVALLSILIRNFWCRYLCPYGALLGVLSFASPFKIRRTKNHCTSCGKCDRACPSDIKVSIRESILSDECTACFRCTDVCPEQGALSFSMPGRKTAIKPLVMALLLLLLFGGGSIAARVGGMWQNNISGREYLMHMVDQKMIHRDVIMKNRDLMQKKMM